MENMGKTIKSLRQRRGMTQDDLANALFLSRQTISNYELGRTTPDIETLTRLSEILDSDLQTLIYGPEDFTAQRKRIRRFLLLTGCSIALLLLGDFLAVKALEWQGRHYDASPSLLLSFLYQPITYALLGWTVVEGVDTLGKLRPVGKNWAKWSRIAVFLIILTYLSTVAVFLFSAVWNVSLPAWLAQLPYRFFVKKTFLGLRVSQAAAWGCGTLFWLSRKD